ncbi:TonB-dependent Receptor Plug Domain protein [compost metagenome]
MKFHNNYSYRPPTGMIKYLLIMKLIFVILTVTILHASANSFGQSVSIRENNIALVNAINEIRKQTGYDFFYNDRLIDNAKKVDLNLKNVSIDEALKACFADQDLIYTIDDKIVTIKPKEVSIVNKIINYLALIEVKGLILDEKGQPLPGATVIAKGTSKSVITDAEGRFILSADQGSTLVVIYVGYKKKEIQVQSNSVTIQMVPDVANLDQVQVIAYGTTTRRLNTGTVAKIKGEDIRNQPVENPVLALSGRLPGVQITQASGNPGAPVSVIIRGKSSLGASSEPLYVIDGVPFAHALGNVTFATGTSAQTLGGLMSGTAGTSPFVNINPADIESMEVLKDADATAIYGSRGANGVVLITTRRAKAGKTTLDFSFNSGWSRPSRLPKMLNTQQYVAMRKEAFKNDGIVPTTANATDLMVWDTTRYTDWTKLLLDKTARSYDSQLRLSGGGQQTQFSLAAGYHRETPPYYGNMYDDRVNLHSNINHRSSDDKFSVSFNATYSTDKNNFVTSDILNGINTIPNAPYPIDSHGNLVWRDQGINFTNPLSYTEKKYIGLTENMLSSINMGYNIANGLRLKLDAGFNLLKLDQTTTNPLKSQSPFNTNAISSAEFFNQSQKNWIAEPQAEYTKQWGKSHLQVLAGGSFQEQEGSNERISASGYTNDELLLTPGPAATKSVTSSYSKYRYTAGFGRISYNWAGKYLVNISARRDGSSRFGPGKQFGNFGAIGTAWIFSEESFMKNLSFLSFGKLRASMGVTGNDRVGNYQYISQWLPTSAAVPYQGTSGIYPYNLENPDYAWERNKKWEMAMELSFLNDRIYVSADYYLNRTDNQLTGLTLPSQVGYSYVNANRDAILQNSGWELMLNTTNIQSKEFSWKTSFNLTIPRNKLIAYPGLEDTYYASVWSIGQPVTISKWIKYEGVDPSTGLHKLTGTSLPKDQTEVYDLAQRYYGGLQNTLSYKGFTLDFFFHFVNKLGKTSILFNAPGTRSNQSIEVLDRWQKPGDITNVQRFTTTGTAATNYSYYANYSDARISNASFIRLKNISLSYQLDKKLAQKVKAENIRMYLQAQNLFTISPYKIGDPETMSFNSMPPLSTMTAGLQVMF